MPENLRHSAKVAANGPPDTTGTRARTSSEKHFRVYEDDWWLRFKRNIRIFIYLAKLCYRWFVFGGRIRKAWRNADKTGQPFILEDIVGMGK